MAIADKSPTIELNEDDLDTVIGGHDNSHHTPTIAPEIIIVQNIQIGNNNFNNQQVGNNDQFNGDNIRFDR